MHRDRRSYIIEHERLLIQKTENRYLTVLVAPWGVNRCRKALFGVISRPDTPTAVFAGETAELLIEGIRPYALYHTGHTRANARGILISASRVRSTLPSSERWRSATSAPASG